MTETSSSPVPPALADARFPPEVLEVLQTLRRAGHEAYLVGGSLRDLLLGLPAKDYDVATAARAQAVQKLFRRTVPTGIKHGTVTVLVKARSIEVTTFRGEGEYKDGRRPDSVTFLDNIVDDLARRDFTINAMAYDPLGPTFVDPFGGAADLSARLLRCVRDARQRFAEDGLRALRAVRFASVLDLRIDPATHAAIPETLDTFAKISGERIRDELLKLLMGPHPGRGLALLDETQLLGRILPELARASAANPAVLPRTIRRVEAIDRATELRLAALLHDVDPEEVGTALERLRLPRKTTESVAQLVAERDAPHAAYPDDAAIRRMLARVGREPARSLLALGAAQATALESPERQANVRALSESASRLLAAHPPLAPGELALDGQQVMAILGAGQGPRVGVAMRFLLGRVLEDPSRNTPEALEKLLRDWEGQKGG